MKPFLVAALLALASLTGGSLIRAAEPSASVAAKTELEGDWRPLSIVNGQDRAMPAQLARLHFSFRGNRQTLTVTTETVHRTGAALRVDPTKEPKEFDLDLDEKPAKEKQPRVFGIYMLEGDRLTLAFSRKSPNERLKAFPPKAEEGIEIVTLERISR